MTPASIDSPARDHARDGVLLGFGAYIMWGLLPLFMKQLQGMPVGQLLAHRMLWTLVFLAILTTVLRRWAAIASVMRNPRLMGLLLITALLIGGNWLSYIWAILNHHVLASSLGYFINPLVNVALGVVFLRERLRPAQMCAVGLAALGVAIMAVGQSGAIWISLWLAFSFGTYGLIRKIAEVDAIEGLMVETMIFAPMAIAYLVWTQVEGLSVFGGVPARDLLLMASGVVTAAPLMLFAAAAKRLRYTTLGLIQYIAPTLQFLQAVLIFREPLGPVHLITFGLIWAGLLIYVIDAVRTGREVPALPPE